MNLSDPTEIPSVTPRFAAQPEDVAWPTREWPRGRHANHDELERVVDEMFTREDLAVTNAVVVVQGGRVLVERYGGVQEFFDRPAVAIDDTSQLLSWSMAKSVLHMIIGTLVDEGSDDHVEHGLGHGPRQQLARVVDRDGGAVEELLDTAVALDQHPATLDYDDGVGDGEVLSGEHLIDHALELVVVGVPPSGPLASGPGHVLGLRGESRGHRGDLSRVAQVHPGILARAVTSQRLSTFVA